MNIVILRGRLSSVSMRRTLSSGTELLNLEITTVTDSGQTSVPVAWFDPPVGAEPRIGDELVVRGSVRRRFFRTSGATQSRTEVVADEVVAVSRRRQVSKMMAAAAQLGQPAAIDVSRAC
ncbi:MAG: hypothetical protein QM733_17265 [Ilumatobacteraceae bacterium]